MSEILVYMGRCTIMLLVTWLGIRIMGKKSVAQMTSYELAALLLLTTAAAEPLVYKIPSKASVGVLTLAIVTILIGWLSVHKLFYNFDTKPSIVIANGKLQRKELKKNMINVPFLISLLRLKGYTKISEVEFAIIEPNGNLSVIPKSQQRPVKPADLQLETKYEGLALPLVIDGEIMRHNLSYAGLERKWLEQEIKKAGVYRINDVYFAELDTQGRLYIDQYQDQEGKAGSSPPEF